MGKINVVVIEDKEIYNGEIENTMEMFEAIVGGDISIAFLFQNYIIICNSVPNSEQSRVISSHSIYGTFIISKMSKESEQLENLNENEIRILTDVFKQDYIEEKDFVFNLIGA